MQITATAVVQINALVKKALKLHQTVLKVPWSFFSFPPRRCYVYIDVYNPSNIFARVRLV